MRPRHIAICGLAVPIVLTVALWAAVNGIIALRSDPSAYRDAEAYFGELLTIFRVPPL